jgi:hypothetical protein
VPSDRLSIPAGDREHEAKACIDDVVSSSLIVAGGMKSGEEEWDLVASLPIKI